MYVDANIEKWTCAKQDIKQLAMLGLDHHQDTKNHLCECVYCQELRTVRNSGAFPPDSLFTRDNIHVKDWLEQFYDALLNDNAFDHE